MSCAKGRAASGFRPKLHSRAEILSLERLDLSRAVGHGTIQVQTFQTQNLGATMQFGSKSGYGATLGASHVQTFQTLCPDFPDSDSRRDYAIWV